MTWVAAVTLIGATGAYLYGVERAWRVVGRGRLISGWHVTCGLSGLATVALATVSPLDAAAHRLLSAHMVQHLLLLLPAAVFLAEGRIGTALLWLVPPSTRRTLARSWPPVRAWARSSGWLAVVWTVHVIVVLAWHVPVAYDAALRNTVLHVFEHGTMTATGVALWWTVLRTKTYGPGAVYALATGVAGSAIGVVMVFSGAAWYPSYEIAAAGADSALADQQFAGAIMWVAGAVGYLLLATWLFVAWLRRVERRPDERWRRQLGPLTAWVLVVGLAVGAAACRPGATRLNPAEAAAIEQGRGAVQAYGCVACHQVPHIEAPQGEVGPSLHGFASRRVIAGQLPNTPENVALWVQNPQAIDPGNVMPALGISDADAVAIAAFLATLE